MSAQPLPTTTQERLSHVTPTLKVWLDRDICPCQLSNLPRDATALLYGETMGFFEARKQRKAAQAAAKQTLQLQTQVQQWQNDFDALNTMLEIVRDCRTGKTAEQFTDNDDYGFMLKKDEFPVAYLANSAYIENVREPTKYSGGYGGVSFPIFGRVRLNAGKTGGKITQGKESIDATDRGNALVTNQRVMFAGTKRTRECRFDKMMNCSHLPGGITIFAMTTGSQPTGIGYGEGPATEVQFRIELASAMALETLDRFEAELIAEQQQLESERPLPSPPPMNPPTT